MDLFLQYILEIPNGYVVELTAKNTDKTDSKDTFKQNPHKILEDWMRKN